jgi:uncharacterized protein with HEPN domain
LSYQDNTARLRHMLDHAREAHAMAQGKLRDDLDADRQLNLSLVRLLEIVGEAASRVSPDFRAINPEISWPEVIGLRNRLVHAYDRIDFDILWGIVSDDLPQLIGSLEQIVEKDDD